MKILHINTHDHGGAANACLRIHETLLQKGIDSKVLVLKKTREKEGVFEFGYWINLKSYWESVCKRIKMRQYKRMIRLRQISLPANPVHFSFPNTIYDITTHPLYLEADIIQLNWVADFLDEASFFEKNTKPVIWRMPDLYTCGGGNHYEKNFPFEAYKPYTDACIAQRQKLLPKQNIQFVPISKWVEDKANNSPCIKQYPQKMIHNGLDLTRFKPYDKEFSRELWNIPLDKKVVLLGADHTSDPRKGFDLALEAIEKINDKDVVFYAFGRSTLNSDKVIMLGNIGDERLLTRLYSAADYYLMSSIEEAFGQVTIEALACGIPVVSFPNGGSVDIVRNGMNGFLSEDFTANGLAKALNNAINHDFDLQEIRKDVEQRFDINDKAEEYITLYQSILEK